MKLDYKSAIFVIFLWIFIKLLTLRLQKFPVTYRFLNTTLYMRCILMHTCPNHFVLCGQADNILYIERII